MPFFAIEGSINDISGIGQRRRQLTIEVRIVLDHKKPHLILLIVALPS
ncbi:hypothetical protein X566_17995 [Afipia sp. P52-10]|nr:hypothetical protein X566_17995 [Afipia sp. P52-10]